MSTPRIVVVGAGPAGLTAAWELIRAGCEVIVLERDPEYVGGLARTMSYKSFRFDVGAHRFYSKNEEICAWWKMRLPDDFIRIKRLTRIYYGGRFFQYPLQAWNAFFGLGIKTSLACLGSYFWRQLRPIRPETSFEDWVTNRFGDRLFKIFFKTYTEKVWGMPCSEISSDWASQRIKGLSLWGAILDSMFRSSTNQKSAKTLIDEFDYPRLGPGMLWERTRDEIVEKGGQMLMGRSVTRFEREGERIVAVNSITAAGKVERWPADAFIVSMPLRECVLNMDDALDEPAQAAAKKLSYRDFILVALILNRDDLFPDNWIYIHSPEVKVGRIENFNNWGKDMVAKAGVTCLEMEYFCFKEDSLWSMSNEELIALAMQELEQLGLAKADEIIDGCVVRVEKAYPVYDSTYQENVTTIRQALSKISNLHMVGRNGMHKYNNQDHSMLTGILAARNICGGRYNVWGVNTDAEYLESEAGGESGRSVPRQKA